jgi:hypothetical protein
VIRQAPHRFGFSGSPADFVRDGRDKFFGR